MRVTGREKIFLWAGLGSLAVLLAFQLVLYPALKRTGELKRLIPQKERELREIRQLRQEFDSWKEAKGQMMQKVPAEERNLAPLSRLDGWVERSGLRQNVGSIKPSSLGAEGMTVEVLMEKAELPQLTRFLYEVQSSPGGFRIVRMSIKPRYTTPKYLDVSLQMAFYKG